MRILSGHLPPTSGALFIDEAPVSFAGPLEAERRGIVLVHQDIVLIAGEVGQADLSEDAIVFLATGVHEDAAAALAAGRP
jgi:ABC-type sugar transport system ATPase subunit